MKIVGATDLGGLWALSGRGKPFFFGSIDRF